MKKCFFASACVVFMGMVLQAQVDPAKQTPESSELWDPVPRIVSPASHNCTTLMSTVPSDALVLFDGKDLSSWKSSRREGGDASWEVNEGVMTVKPKSGDIETKAQFENFQLHLEFKIPSNVEGIGQSRGNSGIFMQGVYELQILDSYENRTYSNGQAGSIFKQTMPLVNASRRPGDWQGYDIIYTAPKFNKDSMYISPAYITVMHNGILIQNHTAIFGTTPYVGQPRHKVHGKGPIRLQDHTYLISFRNIWIREL